MTLALKLFRGEPAISEFDWNFSAIHSSSPHFSTCVWFGPPRCFTTASSCPWIGHPVSGLLYVTMRSFETRFPYGSAALQLNLATHSNSPARSTKSTRSLSLPLLVNIGFQVLFHSPPGVLFTFPSRYYALSVAAEYSALEGGPPGFRQDSTCPDVLRYALGCPSDFAYGAFTLSRRPSQTVPLSLAFLQPRRAPYNPADVAACGLGSSPFARRY